MTIRYVGWIKAEPSQRHDLKKFGVEGKVLYNHEMNCFEYCNCREDIIERLIKKFKGFWCCAFTAMDLNKKQLSIDQQKYWRDD